MSITQHWSLLAVVTASSIQFAAAAPVFGPAIAVTELNSPAHDRISSISDDGLELFLHSRRSTPQSLIYSSTRTDLSSDFGTPSITSLGNINSGTTSKGHAVLTSDSLGLFLSKDVGDADRIHFATREAVGGEWSTPVAILETDLGEYSRPYWLSSDGTRLYMGVRLSGRFQLYLASRPSIDAAFETISSSPFETINLDAGVGEVALSPDELEIIVSRFVDGEELQTDLWWASRGSIDENFGEPIKLTSINSLGEERNPVWHGNDLYFSSDRGGNFDVFRATIVPEMSSLALSAFGLAFGGIVVIRRLRVISG